MQTKTSPSQANSQGPGTTYQFLCSSSEMTSKQNGPIVYFNHLPSPKVTAPFAAASVTGRKVYLLQSEARNSTDIKSPYTPSSTPLKPIYEVPEHPTKLFPEAPECVIAPAYSQSAVKTTRSAPGDSTPDDQHRKNASPSPITARE